MPRKKIPADLRSLARAHTKLAIKTLAGMLGQESVPAAARVAAANSLLDRGWGRPTQMNELQGDVRIVVRQLIDSNGEIIDHDDAALIDVSPAAQD
jgi:hypothetical protein